MVAIARTEEKVSIFQNRGLECFDGDKVAGHSLDIALIVTW